MTRAAQYAAAVQQAGPRPRLFLSSLCELALSDHGGVCLRAGGDRVVLPPADVRKLLLFLQEHFSEGGAA